jgi:uncharacterized protein (TIGR03086 family)
MESIDALQRAVASTARIVRNVRPEQLDAPTPCPDWDVRALANHVLSTLWSAAAAFSDTEPDFTVPPGGVPDRDLVGDDLRAAYDAAADAALAAARREGVLDRPHRTVFGGESPGAMLAFLTTGDTLLHGWDLAQATGQTFECDGELAAHVLAIAKAAMGDQNRGAFFGEVVAVSDDALLIDQLIAYSGRTPR